MTGLRKRSRPYMTDPKLDQESDAAMTSLHQGPVTVPEIRSMSLTVLSRAKVKIPGHAPSRIRKLVSVTNKTKMAHL